MILFKSIKSIISINIVLLLLLPALAAQEVQNEFESRASFSLGYIINDEFRLKIIPEVRFDDNTTLDKYIFEGEAIYKPIKLISLSTKYRLIGIIQDDADTKHYNRYAVSATIKEDFKRFEAAFRIRYSNYSDDEITNKEFLRYKTALEYDISRTSITPYIGAELFHQLTSNKMFKMRYSAGVDYKLFKNNYLSLTYKYDYYLLVYRNKHIVDLSYSIKL